MTEHPAFAALPVPCNAAFQEHSGAGSEQVHAVFGSGVQCFGPVIYQALCTSMLGKELSTGVVNMGLGEPGPQPPPTCQPRSCPCQKATSRPQYMRVRSNKSGARVSAVNMEQSFGIYTPRSALVQWTTLRTT